MRELLDGVYDINISEDWRKTATAGIVGASLALSPMNVVASQSPVKSSAVQNLKQVDDRLYNTVFAENAYAQITDAELKAVISVYLNRVMMGGLETALKGSSAYKKKSRQYTKAENGVMTSAENARYSVLFDKKRAKKLSPGAELDEYNKLDKKLSFYEKKHFDRVKSMVDSMLSDTKKILPYDHHENVKEYGEPYWASKMASHVDIGMQRFYCSKALEQFLKGQNA